MQRACAHVYMCVLVFVCMYVCVYVRVLHVHLFRVSGPVHTASSHVIVVLKRWSFMRHCHWNSSEAVLLRYLNRE